MSLQAKLIACPIGTACFKNENNCLNTNIYSYLETPGSKSSNLYLNVVDFFSTSINLTSVAAQDSCIPAFVSNMCCTLKWSTSSFQRLD